MINNHPITSLLALQAETPPSASLRAGSLKAVAAPN